MLVQQHLKHIYVHIQFGTTLRPRRLTRQLQSCYLCCMQVFGGSYLKAGRQVTSLHCKGEQGVPSAHLLRARNLNFIAPRLTNISTAQAYLHVYEAALKTSICCQLCSPGCSFVGAALHDNPVFRGWPGETEGFLPGLRCHLEGSR